MICFQFDYIMGRLLNSANNHSNELTDQMKEP